MMDDQQLLRYSRQIMLPQFDIVGQEKLATAKVLIMGAGGLGCPVALYLAAAGVGHILLVDDDVVELSNLQRQIAHGTGDLGKLKVESARETLLDINPLVQVDIIDQRLEESELNDVIAQCNVVMDCSDNFATRFAVNRCCVRNKIPLVSGAAIAMEGQIAVFDSRQSDKPCYQCLYKDEGRELDLNCSQNGVMAPLVGIVGSIQALEAIKVIADVGEPLVGKLLLLDAMTMQWRNLKLPKDPTCPVCS